MQATPNLSQNSKAINWTTYIAVTTAALVILSAGILGYTALYDLFLSIGLFAAWLGIFFPLLFDLAEVASAVTVFNAKLQGEDDRFAWSMVLLFTILGIVANVAHALAAWMTGRIDTLQVTLAIFATSLFPLSVALVTHLVKRVIARDIKRRGLLSSLAELTAQRDNLLAEVARIVNQHEQAAAKLEQTQAQIEQARSELKAVHFQQMTPQVEEMKAVRLAKIEQRRATVLDRLEQGMTAADIASELQVSISTVRRDIGSLNGKAKEARGAL